MKSHLFSRRITAAAVLVSAAVSLLADETNDPPPFHYLTNNLAIPSNAPHSLTFIAPPWPVEEPLPDSPGTSTNFLAAGYSNIWPPDTMGAVGTNRITVMINNNVRIQDRGGTVLTNYGLTPWWGSVAPHEAF